MDVAPDGRPGHQGRLLEDEADVAPRGRRRRPRPRPSGSARRSAAPSPAIRRSAVLLPQPDGPSRLRNSCSPIVELEAGERDRAVGEGLADPLEPDQLAPRLAHRRRPSSRGSAKPSSESSAQPVMKASIG